jgi:hypothetical protein
MIPIQHIKFGSSVMVNGRQEASVVSGKTRVGETTIEFDQPNQTYIIVRNGKTVFVHATNVQYSVPFELHTVDDHVEHEDHSFDQGSNDIEFDQVHPTNLDKEDDAAASKPQATRRGRSPRTKA